MNWRLVWCSFCLGLTFDNALSVPAPWVYLDYILFGLSFFWLISFYFHEKEFNNPRFKRED